MSNLRFKSLLITGANRGLGFELVKHFVDLPHRPDIIATYRDADSSKALIEFGKSHDNLHLLEYEVTDYDRVSDIVDATREIVGEQGLNILLNNAAIYKRLSFHRVTAKSMKEHYDVNVVGPLVLAQRLYPLLLQAANRPSKNGLSVNTAAIINITGQMGCMSDNTSGGSYAYRCSKAALHMLTNNLAVDLAGDGVLCCALNPGWIATEMGGQEATYNVTQNAERLVNVMGTLTDHHNGRIYNFKGERIDW